MTRTDLPPMWAHQRDAVEFARGKQGILLHMGLGTGKTRVVIEILEERKARMAVVFAPLSAVPVWAREIAKYAQRDWMAVALEGGTTVKRAKLFEEALNKAKAYGRPLMVTMNYEAACSEAISSLLGRLSPDALICDESHKIKAPKGRNSRQVTAYADQNPNAVKIALSGTPMPHSPMDAWAQFRFLDPFIFGSNYFAFRNRYAVMGGFQAKQVVRFVNQDDMRARMARITFQVGREVLDLPPEMHERIEVELEPRSREVYEQIRLDIIREIEAGEITISNGMVKLLRLQQVTSGFLTAETPEGTKDQVFGTEKQDALADLLEAMAADEPCVVFARFRRDLEAIHAAAKAAGKTSRELSGTRRELEEWQAGNGEVLAVQIQSGAAGIDLTRARYCVYFSIGFNLGDYEQSLRRIHRPGQTRPVTYYHIVAKATVDTKIYSALERRKDLVEAIMADLKSAIAGNELLDKKF